MLADLSQFLRFLFVTAQARRRKSSSPMKTHIFSNKDANPWSNVTAMTRGLMQLSSQPPCVILEEGL
jgi:hypothetical protein